ncbi:MAG: fused response regulator/phosphatase [Nitrospinae bacterium]|nr:fused response regulator/phosphatase [Nitrospinota bacterium]
MKRSHILLVDDNPDNIYLLEVILQARNYATVAAGNGREAITAVENGDIDLILMDVMMPEMDGFEASRHIRNRPESAHIPIIMMTAKKRELTDVVRGLDEGALEYLTKPFEEEELLARVKSMLRIKHLHDDNRELLDKVLKQQKMMEQELKVAEKVQYAMLPDTNRCPCDTGKCRVDAFYRAATSVGGDFYDILDYGKNRAAFLIADVSGHGPSAALIVAMLKAQLINEKHDLPSPAEMLRRLNKKLLPLIPDDSFITAFFGVMDMEALTFTYSRAGHPPAFIVGINGQVRDCDAPGTIMGMFEVVDFSEKTEQMESGDKLFMYSDGIFEVPDKEGNLFGMHRLRNSVVARAPLPGKEMLAAVVKEADAYWDGETVRDDVAAVVLEIL